MAIFVWWDQWKRKVNFIFERHKCRGCKKRKKIKQYFAAYNNTHQFVFRIGDAMYSWQLMSVLYNDRNQKANNNMTNTCELWKETSETQWHLKYHTNVSRAVWYCLFECFSFGVLFAILFRYDTSSSMCLLFVAIHL